MVYSVVFSERASAELTRILKYIEEGWSYKTANEFSFKVDEKINNLITNPFIYPAYKSKKFLRRCVITEQISMYYRIKNSEIEVITLFDTRQNPQKLKLK